MPSATWEKTVNLDILRNESDFNIHFWAIIEIRMSYLIYNYIKMRSVNYNLYVKTNRRTAMFARWRHLPMKIYNTNILVSEKCWCVVENYFGNYFEKVYWHCSKYFLKTILKILSQNMLSVISKIVFLKIVFYFKIENTIWCSYGYHIGLNPVLVLIDMLLLNCLLQFFSTLDSFSE